MATFFDWIKLLLENKWLLILAFSTISSMTGNIYGYFQLDEKDKQIVATQKQVTAVAEAYREEIPNLRPATPNKLSLPRDVLKRLEWLEAQH